MARSVRFDCQRLEVFGHAVQAVAVIDELAEELPEGRGYIRDQLQRAANSIALNIAEGAGEFVPAEKARFYRMAKRSATECAAGSWSVSGSGWQKRRGLTRRSTCCSA
jgi:four helix bundle protein